LEKRRTPTVVFGEWAERGRDEGMAKGHQQAVDHMLEIALNNRKSFSFLDAGCGNGWVVRKVAKHPQCVSASGVDGAKQMIDKAQTYDSKNHYTCANLDNWKPNSAVDIVHSMEVVYYLKDPSAFLENVYNSWISEAGMLIVGLDFYKENTVSHSWPKDCGVSIMHLFSEKHWIELIRKAGFKKVESTRFGVKENWSGTLILRGQK
jgi:predicted TPR repeat methyltransferase